MARIPGEFRHGVEVGVEVLSRYPAYASIKEKVTNVFTPRQSHSE
jgi:hypothetical protein